MDAIAGGTGTSRPLTGALVVDVGPASSEQRPASSEQRIADALLRCMGRWGLAKTTIEDLAREAGLSRATVYRFFPGGKTAILEFAAQSQVHMLVALLADELEAIDDLEECIVRGVVLASGFLSAHEALSFMAAHEPVVLEQVLGFDRLDALFVTAGQLMEPVLGRFLEPADAREVTIWLTRLVVSYLYTPSPSLDLTDLEQARPFVHSFVMPGIAAATSTRPVPQIAVPGEPHVHH